MLSESNTRLHKDDQRNYAGFHIAQRKINEFESIIEVVNLMTIKINPVLFFKFCISFD